MSNPNTSSSESPMVTGLFRDRESAERAYESVSARGYGRDDVNLLMSDDTRKTHFSGDASEETCELGSKAAEGAGIGGAIGGTVGAIATALAAVGTSISSGSIPRGLPRKECRFSELIPRCLRRGSSFAIPGLGLVVAGPVAAALAGAGAGGLTGGLVGALVGWGIPEERVSRYEQGIKEGGIVMGVKSRSGEDAKHFESEWKRNRGEDVYQ